jgi:hypothetical protein
MPIEVIFAVASVSFVMAYIAVRQFRENRIWNERMQALREIY